MRPVSTDRGSGLGTGGGDTPESRPRRQVCEQVGPTPGVGSVPKSRPKGQR